MAIPNPNPNIADGYPCDNKTYSSNKIEDLIQVATELPVIHDGDAGKVLTVNADSDAYELDAIPTEVPEIASGDAGKVITVNAGETAYELATPVEPESIIDDEASAADTVYSSSKVDTLLSDKQDAISVTTATATPEEGTTIADNYLRKYGKVVQVNLTLTVTSVTRWATVATLPEGYRPKDTITVVGCNVSSASGEQFCSIQITDGGFIRFANALPDSNAGYSVTTDFITD